MAGFRICRESEFAVDGRVNVFKLAITTTRAVAALKLCYAARCFNRRDIFHAASIP
jgi:hypothetical protein